MASLRLVLPASALLLLLLCWSVDANPTDRPSPLGVVANYVTPMANFSIDKLAGRWYMAEVLQLDLRKNVTSRLCLLLDFHYDDNGTFVVAPIGMLDGVTGSPLYTFPVSENGVWDAIYFSVSGEAEPSTSHLVVHVDDRFLAVASCKNDSVKSCAAYTLVRHVADGDRHSELEDLRRRLASAGVDNIAGITKVIEPCRSVTTATPAFSVQNASSTPHTERKHRRNSDDVL